MPVLVFDIETIPDVAGIRAIENLPAGLSDYEVAEWAFQQRRASQAGQQQRHIAGVDLLAVVHGLFGAVE